MKNILYCSLLLFGLASCRKTLQESPKSIAEENFYNTPAEVQAALGAIYSPLRGSECLGAVYQSIQEATGDWFQGRASYAPISLFNGLDGTNTTRVGLIWNDFYLSIRNANLVVRDVPKGDGLTDDQKNASIGEARFMRALNYFFLVRNWGGVPLRTEQTMDSISIPRANPAAVYQLIVSDLSFAENNLPDVAPVSGRPSKWAAKTLLADVYFYEADYSDASQKAGEVIASGKYALLKVNTPDDFNNLFGAGIATTPEEIFYLDYATQSTWAFPLYTAGVGTPYLGVDGYYAIYSNTTNPLYANWDNNDFRKAYGWYSWNTPLGPTVILNKKFTDPGSKTPDNSYTLYRYADLLLLYAEATSLAAGAPTADAMEKLNMVHRRAYGYDPLQASPVDFQLADYDLPSFVTLTIRERGYETQAEGKRWLDLVRSGKAAQSIQAAWGKTVSQKAFLWPIPVSELNYNKALDPAKDQNPGY
ncbi:MAG TPA: RagB/SusD family nutrient uptake outer membrane protein [Puia sp.]|nr:RagB/SusD family nutrient uptake outer membrane protein [Puia sp.]